MEVSKIRHRNAAKSVIIGRLPQLCSDIFSKTTKSIVGIQKRVRFALNRQILSLTKFDVWQSQKAGKACNFEPMSVRSNGCINFEETVLGCGRQKKESALNTSPNELYKIRPGLSLNSSKLCKSELDIICSSLNSAVRRIAFLDHLQSFSESKISYSDLLRMFCQNLSRAFNHSQNHLTGHCFHQSEDHVLATKLGNHGHSLCASCPADEAVSIVVNSSDAFSARFSQDQSERNTDRFKQNETSKVHAGFAFSGMKSECTKTDSLATNGIYSNSSSYDFHMTAADESGKVSVTRNSSCLDENLSDFDLSNLSMNDAMITMPDSPGQLASCLSHTQSTATCDKKTSRRKRRRRQFYSVKQSHKLCRKQNDRQSKSRANLRHMSRPQVQLSGSHHSSVRSNNNCTGVKYLMDTDTLTYTSQKKKDLGLNLKLPLRDLAKDVNCAERRHTCLEMRNCETTDDDDDLSDGTRGFVMEDEETDDEVADDENTDEEETDENMLTDDESNSANIWDDEITDEKTDKVRQLCLNGIATAFVCNRNDKVDTTASVKTFCKSSFFISPSEIDSSDLSSDNDEKDDEDNDLEVDGWDSSEDESVDTLLNGICESFSFNGLYFPSSCSAVEAKLSLEELKENDRTRLLSVTNSPSASTLDWLGLDNSSDDIVFCDDQESLSCPSEDEEDLPLSNFSRMQSINARWNNFYSEAEKPTQNKKQVKRPVSYLYNLGLLCANFKYCCQYREICCLT